MSPRDVRTERGRHPVQRPCRYDDSSPAGSGKTFWPARLDPGGRWVARLVVAEPEGGLILSPFTNKTLCAIDEGCGSRRRRQQYRVDQGRAIARLQEDRRIGTKPRLAARTDGQPVSPSATGRMRWRQRRAARDRPEVSGVHSRRSPPRGCSALPRLRRSPFGGWFIRKSMPLFLFYRQENISERAPRLLGRTVLCRLCNELGGSEVWSPHAHEQACSVMCIVDT